MARRGDVRSRNDITDTVEKHQTDMQEKGEELEKPVEDVETVRETLDALDLGGTSEGADEVEQAIEGAEDVSVEDFDRGSGELEEIQHESEEHEGEIEERSDNVSSDLGKISDASARIHGDGANRELVDAKESALRDVDFLKEQTDRAQEARDESQRLHDEHVSRVNAGRRS